MKYTRIQGEEPVEGDEGQFDVVLQQEVLHRRQVSGYEAPKDQLELYVLREVKLVKTGQKHKTFKSLA